MNSPYYTARQYEMKSLTLMISRPLGLGQTIAECEASAKDYLQCDELPFDVEIELTHPLKGWRIELPTMKGEPPGPVRFVEVDEPAPDRHALIRPST